MQEVGHFCNLITDPKLKALKVPFKAFQSLQNPRKANMSPKPKALKGENPKPKLQNPKDRANMEAAAATAVATAALAMGSSVRRAGRGGIIARMAEAGRRLAGLRGLRGFGFFGVLEKDPRRARGL